jgi:HD-like signal output (HDOD) protein
MEPFNLAALLGETDLDEQKAVLKRFVDSMPAFSPATAKILKLAARIDSQPAEIVAAIRMDPILTGKVLQLVNSAYFSLAQKVTSLNRAVVYLGINTIKNLALSTAVMQAFETKNKELAELIRPAWYHSLATAVCTKNLARAASVDPKILEEYFILGLLHDVGKIILMQAFHGRTPHNGSLTLGEEKKKYGVDRSQVSVDTLTRWKFSDDLVQAIGVMYNPPAGNKMSNLLHVGDAMSYRLGLNGNAEAKEQRPIVATAFSAIGLSEEQVHAALADAPEQIQKAEVFLNIAGSKERVVEKE